MEAKIQGFLTDRKNKYIFFSVVIFSLIAHLFRWVNPLFNHDAMMIWQNDWALQTSTGRFVSPYYTVFRGKITAPWLIGVLSMVYLIISVKMITEVLELKSIFSVIVIGGIFSVFPVYTVANSSYLPWVDIYMLSLMLSVSAVWFCVKFKFGWMPAAVCLALSMGLYQCYIESAVMLFLCWFIREGLIGNDWKSIIRQTVRFAAAALLAGLGYYLGWRLFLRFRHVTPANYVNSISGMGNFSGVHFGLLIKDAYLWVFRYFGSPESPRPVLDGWINLLLGLAAAIPLFIMLLKCRKRFPILIVLLISPLAANFVYILSKGYIYLTMIYSFAFFYVLVCLVFEVRSVAVEKYRGVIYTAVEKVLLAVLFSVLIFDSIIYANQTYLERTLADSATLSAMTRILDKMEHTEGYDPKTTEVVFIGDLNESDVAFHKDYFEHVWYQRNYSPTHYWSYRQYFEYVLGYPLSAASDSLIPEYKEKTEVIEMPSFPHGDYCRMVDGRLVVKFSSGMNMELPSDMERDE